MQLSEHDDEQLQLLARAVAKALSDDRGPRADYNRYLSVGAILIGMVTFVFSVGVNWSKVTYHDQRFLTVEARVTDIEKAIGAFRQELGSQNTSIQAQLGDIKGQLGQIQGQLLSGRK